MATHCGENDGWHDERGFGDGHTVYGGVGYCPGRQPEQLYTMEQAIVLGRRALCESSDTGHQIERQGGFVVRQADGRPASQAYCCGFCDATVTVTYPPLAGGHAGG